MTSRATEVLAFVQDLRMASGQQLRRRFWSEGDPESAARMARRSLAGLVEVRVLDRLDRRVGGVRAGSDGFIYFIGPVGLRLLARKGLEAKRLDRPGDRFIAHTLDIAERVIELFEADRAHRIEVLGIETEPQCWRGFIGGMGARKVLKPDLFVRIGDGPYEERWFVEVDRATEARGTLQSKLDRYLEYYRSDIEQRDHGFFPRVIWSVPDERRLEQLIDLIGTLPAEHWPLFAVTTADRFIAAVTPEGVR